MAFMLAYALLVALLTLVSDRLTRLLLIEMRPIVVPIVTRFRHKKRGETLRSPLDS